MTLAYDHRLAVPPPEKPVREVAMPQRIVGNPLLPTPRIAEYRLPRFRPEVVPPEERLIHELENRARGVALAEHIRIPLVDGEAEEAPHLGLYRVIDRPVELLC